MGGLGVVLRSHDEERQRVWVFLCVLETAAAHVI